MPMEQDFIGKKRKTCFRHRMTSPLTPEVTYALLGILVVLFVWSVYRSYLFYRESPSRWWTRWSGEAVVNAVIGGGRKGV